MPYKDIQKNKDCKIRWSQSEEGKAKQKAYYENNKEDILAKGKEYRKKRLENMSEADRLKHDSLRKERVKISYHKHKKDPSNIKSRKESSFKSNLKYLYGISYERYLEILKEQNLVCAICGCKEFEKRWTSKNLPFAVDHCHVTKEVRGLLCDNCNVMLGHAKDNINLLQKAIEYLNNDKRRN